MGRRKKADTRTSKRKKAVTCTSIRKTRTSIRKKADTDTNKRKEAVTRTNIRKKADTGTSKRKEAVTRPSIRKTRTGIRKKADTDTSMGKKDDTFTSLLQNNQIEDVRWLCSLSESELDLLISLKMLVMRRAEKFGCQCLAEKFNLKMLRHLSFTMMEHLKEQLKDLSAGPDPAETVKLLDECNLSRLHVNESLSEMSPEELREYIFVDRSMNVGKRKSLEQKDTAPIRKSGGAKGRSAKGRSAKQS